MEACPTIVRSNILFLPGVRRDDYVTPEQQAAAIALDFIDTLPPMSPTYDVIPRIFKSLDEWPKHTNLRCWWCTLQFQTMPWFYPERYYPIDGAICMDVVGVFNTIPCVIAYAIGMCKGDRSRLMQSYDNIKRMVKTINGRIVTRLEPAIDKTKMNMYGGALTVEDYLTELKKIEQKLCAAFMTTDADSKQPFTISSFERMKPY